jgi:hypothetical protein
VKVADLLKDVQVRHEQAMARADDLRRQIEHLTTALAETERRLAELATARKIVQEITPDGTDPQPDEPASAYQQVLDTFNHHPDQPFRVRELHELLSWPTDDPSLNVTRSRLGRLTRQGFLTQPGRGIYQKRT